MSLVDKFDDQTEAAFTREFDPESARRQFRVSLVLVGAMAVAAFILGFAIPVGGSQSASTTQMVGDSTGFTGRLVSIDER